MRERKQRARKALRRIATPPLIKEGGFEYRPDEGRRDQKVLDVEEAQALAENLRLVVLLDAETLARISGSKPRLERIADLRTNP